MQLLHIINLYEQRIQFQNKSLSYYCTNFTNKLLKLFIRCYRLLVICDTIIYYYGKK